MLLHQVTDSHITIMTDNTLTVSCLNKMGSKSAVLNDLTCTLWKWYAERKLWLNAAHIPGVANVEADKLSRDLHLDTVEIEQSAVEGSANSSRNTANS